MPKPGQRSSLARAADLACLCPHEGTMGKHHHGSDHEADQGLPRERRAHIDRQNQLLHRSVFAHLTRRVADPDRPGEQITFGELDLRLRGRAYRQAVQVSQRSTHAVPDPAAALPRPSKGAAVPGG